MQLGESIKGLIRATPGSQSGWAERGPALVTAILVLAIAAQLAALAWRFLTPALAPESVYGSSPATVPTLDLPSIINAHLFGVAPVALDPGAAPASSANLVLAGTLAGRDPESGWAIIGPSAQGGRVYATGMNLPGGAKLVAVYPDRVILDRNGRRESLSLPRLTGSAGPTPVTYQPTGAMPSTLADGVRELIAQDPAAISEVLRPQPVFAGGQQKGYRVYPGRNREQFVRLGLQAGDLITAINGAPLDDPNRGLDTLRSIGAGGSVMLSIERNGQSQQLTVDSSNVVRELHPVNEAAPVAPPESSE